MPLGEPEGAGLRVGDSDARGDALLLALPLEENSTLFEKAGVGLAGAVAVSGEGVGAAEPDAPAVAEGDPLELGERAGEREAGAVWDADGELSTELEE